MGGAYYYPKFRPVFKNITFINNSAPYGADIGSIPIKVYINDTLSQEITIDNAASG